MSRDLALAGNVAWHDARFTQYLFVDDSGATVDVAGHQLPWAPRVLASAGLLYTPPRGVDGTVVVNYVGRRYLDEENTAPVGGPERAHRVAPVRLQAPTESPRRRQEGVAQCPFRATDPAHKP